MPLIASTTEADFVSRFKDLLDHRRKVNCKAFAAAMDIVADVRQRGDIAVAEYAREFDHCEFEPGQFRFSDSDIDAIANRAKAVAVDNLVKAADRIHQYHDRQIPQNCEWKEPSGARIGWRWTAIDSVGLYVPGGTASYPSSVLMGAIPARIAGVRDLAMTIPPVSRNRLNPLVFAAARIAGINRIYSIGGAQAVAAFAYGTESIEPVDMIAGPGNAFVTAAKRCVVGDVGIDMIAGPSEVLIIASQGANPAWLAADLIAQAEHDDQAQAIFLTDCEALRDRVVSEVEALLSRDARPQAKASWQEFGAAILVNNLAEAADLSNQVSPEHLELLVENPRALLEDIRHAGAVFVGSWTPEAIGDYVAGPSHVLPTAGTARFASGLSVLSFMKRTSIVEFSSSAMADCGPAAAHLANAEGLSAHALSVRLRLNGIDRS